MKRKTYKIAFIAYCVFLLCGGMTLFISKYRILAEIPLVLLWGLKKRKWLMEFIHKCDMGRVIVRICVIAASGVYLADELERMTGNRIAGIIVVAVSLIVIYTKWLTMDIVVIKKIPYVIYLSFTVLSAYIITLCKIEIRSDWIKLLFFLPMLWWFVCVVKSHWGREKWFF